MILLWQQSLHSFLLIPWIHIEDIQYGLFPPSSFPFCLQATLILGGRRKLLRQTWWWNSDLLFVTPSSAKVFLERENGVCLCTVVFDCQMDLIQLTFIMTEFLPASHVLLINDKAFYAKWIAGFSIVSGISAKSLNSSRYWMNHSL